VFTQNQPSFTLLSCCFVPPRQIYKEYSL